MKIRTVYKTKGGESLPLARTSLLTTPSAGSNAARNACSESSQKKKLSYKEQKEFETLDAEIPQLEKEQHQLEADMCSSDFETQSKAAKRYKEIEELLAEKYSRWEELSEYL